MAKEKVSKEQRKIIRDTRKMMNEAMKMDVNEAETRRRVELIFKDIMGYDVLKHLSREHAIHGVGETEHVDFAIQIESGPNPRPIVMIELKRIGIDLSKKHLKQVTSYAIDAGCEWLLLTNGREWKVYHIEFGQPPKVEILDSWNLLEDEIDKLVEKFEIISYKSVKRDGLNKRWKHVKVLAPRSLLSAIISENTLRIIRSNLRKNTEILVSEEEVYVGINKLLNESAAIAMSGIKISKPVKRARKHEKEVKCSICGASFKNEVGLKLHMQAKHKTEEKETHPNSEEPTSEQEKIEQPTDKIQGEE